MALVAIMAPPERQGLFSRAMNELHRTLDQEHQSALVLLHQIQMVRTAWKQLCAHDILGITPYTSERNLDNAHHNLLEGFRKRVHAALAENRHVVFPDSFLEQALEIERDGTDAIWSRWNAMKVIRHRNSVLGDLKEAEWQQALRVAAGFLGDALRNHILSKNYLIGQTADSENFWKSGANSTRETPPIPIYCARRTISNSSPSKHST